jgi:hypothetical protein
MTFEQLLVEYRLPMGLLASLAFINGLLAHRELVRLKTQAPNLLKQAGINQVDWLFRCIRGVLRLGFGKEGSDLPTFSRLVFKGIGFHYAWLLSLMFLVVLGVLRIDS